MPSDRRARYNEGMDLTMRPVTADEFAAFSRAIDLAFGEHVTEDQTENWRRLQPLDRTLAVFDGSRIVANSAAFSLELTVPGPRRLPAAGVTAVGVAATHRRKGLLTRMMTRLLDDAAERGEPLAILGASEGGIYGRFGFGVATWFQELEILRSAAVWREAPADTGRLVLLDEGEAGKLLPPFYDRMRRITPGAVGRSEAWWKMLLDDAEWLRRGEGKRFDVIHERHRGEVDGYITYRVKHGRRDDLRDNVLSIVELNAADDEVRLALWRYALSVDLITRVRAYAPIDEPMGWRLADRRALRTRTVRDMLWCRVLDVPVALGTRTYGVADRLVLRVEDGFRPASGGTFELEGGPEGAECRPTTAEPDLVLGSSQLGSAYLGGTRLASLARAGLVAEVTEGAVARADRMFTVDPAPWCDTDF
jgi:predicted acetyltransferase